MEQKEKTEKLRELSPFLLTENKGQNFPIPDLINAKRIILIDGQTNIPSKTLTYGICTFGANNSIHKKHHHKNADEIMYIISGKGIGGVGSGEEFEQRPGDTIYCPAGVDHWFYNPFDEPCSMIWIYTKPTLRDAGYNLESRNYKDINYNDIVEKNKN